MSRTDTGRDSVSLFDGVGEVEKEERLIKRWKRRAKGKPMRWRILRDVVACLSLSWMSTSEIQMCMRRLYALKNRTTRDILEELEEEKAIRQEKDSSGYYKWGSSPSGVTFWIIATANIPASIALVVGTTMNVNESEA